MSSIAIWRWIPNGNRKCSITSITTFKPAAEKFDGFIDLKMLKRRKVIHGGPPPAASINYRFQLTYQSEEKRQVWIASEVHGKVWPLIENTLTDKGYLVLLTDSM